VRCFAEGLLRDFTRSVLQKVGVPAKDADLVSCTLVQADLEGIDSHGISRLPVYVLRIMEGRINPRPQLTFREEGCILKVEGDRGLGQVVSYRAVEAGIPIAKKYGLAGIFVRNSNHNGASSFYCQQAIKQKMAIMAMTNSTPGIAPIGGKAAFLGTNPIAFGFPAKQDPPVIVDMSSSVVARGKIIMAAKQGTEIPIGWGLDEDGAETTDPYKALKGSVLPLGGVKGYALAVAIELFSGVLSGAAFGKNVQSIYEDDTGTANVGHHFVLVHIPHILPYSVYLDRIEQFLKELKAVPLAKHAEAIYYPGERRYQRYIQRKRNGIPLTEEIVEELNQTAKMCHLDNRL
jgi:LDH2 family malate/lactate/ureidoglycolate dehydrogenase